MSASQLIETLRPIYMPARPGEAPQPAPEMMTQDECARFLRLTTGGESDPGPDAVRQSLRRYRRRIDNPLPAVRVGNQVLYPLAGVLSFVNSQSE